jgi:hypothetical protein
MQFWIKQYPKVFDSVRTGYRRATYFIRIVKNICLPSEENYPSFAYI